MPNMKEFPRGVPGTPLHESKAPHALWLDPEEALKDEHWQYDPEKQAKRGKVFLGELNGRHLVGVKDNRHMMTIAGSRAGKGVSTIIPNLIEYPGSILVIDPKGENAQVTANRRGMGSHYAKRGLGQDVFVLDPFRVSGHKTSCFNPLEMIDPESETAVDDAALIAEAMIIQAEGEGRHWTASARNFLRGLILFIRTDKDPASQNLMLMRQHLLLDKISFNDLLADMKNASGWPKCDHVIRGAANSLDAKEDKERAGVLSAAIEQTEFLDSEPLCRTLLRSDFSLRDLKRRPTTVYLCLPARFMSIHSRWLRIVVNLAVAAMEIETAKPEHPVLFLMDEFAVLDRLESIEKAAGQIAGFDCLLWPILQDISQLRSIYKDRWETFMGNAGLLQFFGNNDHATLDYISKRLGKTTIVKASRGEVLMEQTAKGLHGVSTQLHETDLMTADEVGRFFSRQTEAQILMWPGADPLAIDRVSYYEHHYFQDKYDHDPRRK
jgi:type IV secretion system protein VirD4